MKRNRIKSLCYVPADFKKFLVTGSAATSLDYILYSVLCIYFHTNVSKLGSMLFTSIFSFVVNRNWTFLDEKSLTIRKICKYILVQALNIFVNVSVNSFVLWVTQKRLFSFVIATGSAMVLNFLCQKFFVFCREKQ